MNACGGSKSHCAVLKWTEMHHFDALSCRMHASMHAHVASVRTGLTMKDHCGHMHVLMVDHVSDVCDLSQSGAPLTTSWPDRRISKICQNDLTFICDTRWQQHFNERQAYMRQFSLVPRMNLTHHNGRGPRQPSQSHSSGIALRRCIIHHHLWQQPHEQLLRAEQRMGDLMR